MAAKALSAIELEPLRADLRTLAELTDKDELTDWYVRLSWQQVAQLLATVDALVEALEPFAHEEFYKIEGRDRMRAYYVYEQVAALHQHPGYHPYDTPKNIAWYVANGFPEKE